MGNFKHIPFINRPITLNSNGKLNTETSMKHINCRGEWTIIRFMNLSTHSSYPLDGEDSYSAFSTRTYQGQNGFIR